MRKRKAPVLDGYPPAEALVDVPREVYRIARKFGWEELSYAYRRGSLTVTWRPRGGDEREFRAVVEEGS
jgi:hypothetical protein